MFFFWVPILDLTIGCVFLHSIFHRPRRAVWAARYFMFRLGWYVILPLVMWEALQHLRRYDLIQGIGYSAFCTFLLVVVSVLQLLAVRLGDRLVIASQCTSDGSHTSIHFPVLHGMKNITDVLQYELGPLGRQTAASFCNLESARQSLYTSRAISNMDTDESYAWGAESTHKLRQDMLRQCAVLGRTALHGALDANNAKGKDLTHLAHFAAKGYMRYLDISNKSQQAGIASAKLHYALAALPSRPGLWDPARQMPVVDGSWYQQAIRPILSTPLLPPAILSIVDGIIITAHVHPGYRKARRAITDFRTAIINHSLAVEAFYITRCACSDATRASDPLPDSRLISEGELDEALSSYQRQYLFTISATIPPDRAPIDTIISLRRMKPPCTAMERARDRVVQQPSQHEREWRIWKSKHCSALMPLTREEEGIWEAWPPLLGVDREKLRDVSEAKWWRRRRRRFWAE